MQTQKKLEGRSYFLGQYSSEAKPDKYCRFTDLVFRTLTFRSGHIDVCCSEQNRIISFLLIILVLLVSVAILMIDFRDED